VRTFYVDINIGYHGDFSDIEQRANLDVCRLIAVQGIAIEDITAEERSQFGNRLSTYTFKVRAKDYNEACDFVSAILSED